MPSPHAASATQTVKVLRNDQEFESVWLLLAMSSSDAL